MVGNLHSQTYLTFFNFFVVISQWEIHSAVACAGRTSFKLLLVLVRAQAVTMHGLLSSFPLSKIGQYSAIIF